MRFIRLGLFAFLMMVLFSCSRPAQKMAGIVVYGHEVRTIQFCGQSQVFWLHMASPQRRKLDMEMRKIPQNPYQGLYLELSGSMSKNPPGEFAKEYDGTFNIVKIIKISATIPDNCI